MLYNVSMGLLQASKKKLKSCIDRLKFVYYVKIYVLYENASK